MAKKLLGWNELPMGGIPPFPSEGYKTGGWRTFKPILDDNKCTRCFLCWIHCPDMAIKVELEESGKKAKRFYIDYDFCKGCGICANVCPVKAIEMVLEE